MTWIDALLILALLGFAFAGWRLRASLLLAVLCALALSPLLATQAARAWGPWLQAKAGAWAGPALTYWLAFALILLFIGLAFRMLGAMAETLALSAVDSLLGALLAALLGLAALAPLDQALGQSNPGWRQMQEQPKCYSCRSILPQARQREAEALAWLRDNISSKLGPS
jgi:uncharacterized membrane protein required for colicin V production